jgi:Fe-S-cluster containining protein
MYQMIAKDCPHLITEGKYNSCAIYQHRPLACRAFPMSGQVNYSTKCRATKDVRGGLQITGDMTWSYIKINNLTKRVIQSANGLLWVYNFQKDTWERVTKELLAPVRKL